MKAALFDLDGTIIDTRDMILASFRYAYIKVFGEDSLPPDEKLLSLIGIPLRQQMDIISAEKSDELFDAYHESNRMIHDKMIADFEGTTEALTQLKDQGLRMAIITSKRHQSAVRGLEKTNLLSFFEFVIGADDCDEHKPSPGPLYMAAERMGLEYTDCAYTGDSPFDMQAARAADMYAVGALWGMFTKQELLDAGAEVLVPNISELPQVFA